jgi:hypothetical protein
MSVLQADYCKRRATLSTTSWILGRLDERSTYWLGALGEGSAVQYQALQDWAPRVRSNCRLRRRSGLAAQESQGNGPEEALGITAKETEVANRRHTDIRRGDAQ